jgi:hypothetical protein
MKTLKIPPVAEKALEEAVEVLKKGLEYGWVRTAPPDREIAVWAIRAMAEAIVQRGSLVDNEIGKLRIRLESPTEDEAAVDDLLNENHWLSR